MYSKMYRKKNSRTTTNNMMMDKRSMNGKQEYKDWLDVDERFGPVYEGNKFWLLREKKTNFQIVEEKLSERKRAKVHCKCI